MKFKVACLFPLACFKPTADLAPAIQAPAHKAPVPLPISFDIRNLPNDLLDAIAEIVKEPRDLRSFRLAFSIADVPTEEINDHITAIFQVPTNTKHYAYDKRELLLTLELGQIWTSRSRYIEHYKAIEGKDNPRTNKPFKFDSIFMNDGWQDDPDWQSWNWTNVREVSFRYVQGVNATHAKLPLTRLNGLKTIDFDDLYTNGGYAIAFKLLKQNRKVDLRVNYSPYTPPMPSQLAQTVCSLKKLKGLTVLNSRKLVENILTCLPADNELKQLAISPGSPYDRIVATPAIIAKLRLNQFWCAACEFGWTDLSGLERLTWKFNENHDETVRVTNKLMSMKSLQCLHLVQSFVNFSPEEFKLIRKIAPLVDEVEIYYRLKEGLLKALPEFQLGEHSGQFRKIKQAK